MTGPTQVLVRCHRIDLTPLADTLQQDAAALPHPALEQAARAHAGFLADLAAGGNLLGRQIVLVAREEPAARRHAAQLRSRAGTPAHPRGRPRPDVGRDHRHPSSRRTERRLDQRGLQSRYPHPYPYGDGPEGDLA
ncbi:hypothetical protein ACRAWF_38090 [Streptomyces sp. L7]